jgi:hypothetical protein
MCELADKTPAELNAMTKVDIIAEILEGVRRRSRTKEEDERGNAVRMDETITDAYGELVGTREILWTYYNTGEVNVITVRERDDKGKLLGGYVVKHYTDGKQPKLNIIKPN